MRRVLMIVLCLLAAVAQGAFVTKARWAERGVKNRVIEVDAHGKPRVNARVWGLPVQVLFDSPWEGTHRAVPKGREFDLPNGRKLRWETSDDLAPFETKAGELKHLAEWGAHVTSVEFAAAPPAGFVVSHKIELPVGSRVAYQPELTQAEKDEGCARPAAIVGSYAVFGPEGCKIAHVPRPCLVDANGKRAWGTLNINPEQGTPAGIFNSVVRFKATAFDGLVFPVTAYGLDTFGYTSQGGSSETITTPYPYAYGPVSPASSGSATSVSAYIYTYGTTFNITLALFNEGASKPGTRIEDGGGTTTTAIWSYNWETDTLDSAASVTGGTNYYLAIHTAASSIMRYDAGSGTSWWGTSTAYSHGVVPNVAWGSNSSSRDHSIYCTYTPGAAGAPAAAAMHHFRMRRAH